MATIYLKVEAERTEGKFMSGSDVEDEVVALVDGESVQVEDSEYELTAEVVEQPKRSGAPSLNLNAVEEALYRLSQAHHDAWPVVIKLDADGPDDEVRAAMSDEVRALDSAIWHLLHTATALTNRGKMRVLKAGAK